MLCEISYHRPKAAVKGRLDARIYENPAENAEMRSLEAFCRLARRVVYAGAGMSTEQVRVSWLFRSFRASESSAPQSPSHPVTLALGCAKFGIPVEILCPNLILVHSHNIAVNSGYS